MKSKRGMELELIGWMIAGIVVLIIILIAIGILSGKGTSAIDYAKSLLGLK